VGAHGVRGEVKLESFTEYADEIAAYGDLYDETGTRPFPLAEMRAGPKGILARFAGVTDRNAAEDLRGVRLYVPRSRLPRLREEDAYYQADLIGLAAELGDGSALGRVRAVQNFGAGDLLEIDVPGRKNTLLVPFTRAVVPTVDMTAGRVVIEPPPGLLDEGGTPPPADAAADPDG
jgi:16S rRNA processing protein RimM